MDAYVNHVFNASVEGVFQEFERGFFQVCDRDLVKLFRPKELQEVLVGKDFHDWAKLKQVRFKTQAPHGLVFFATDLSHPHVQQMIIPIYYRSISISL